MKSLTLLFLVACVSARAAVVASKADTEGFVLGEYAAQTLEAVPEAGKVTRRFGLGGTGILVQALRAGEIDVYPEYTGTIAQTLLHNPEPMSAVQIKEALKPLGLVISDSLGFSNSYAIAATADFARQHHLSKISDLKSLPKRARIAFSSEFMTRPDGFSGLTARYGLALRENVRSMAHSLAFEAARKGEADVIDVYTTDAKVAKLGLVVLTDDRAFFPRYEAVFIARRKFVDRSPREWEALQRLGGRFNEPAMRRLNGAVDLDKRPVASVVAEDRGQSLSSAAKKSANRMARILRRTREHMLLVGFALAFSILAGVPLGILAARREGLGQLILLLSGTVQTVPSLALLCFLIPVFGVGLKPALAALCLYGLLPVVLNTFIGLRGIDPHLRDAAQALGLGLWNRLSLIELPLASPQILAGIKTSAIIGIGTATLAALIGAGGYGAPIVNGLAINDMNEILNGAVPAAVMALMAHVLFEGLERLIVPKGLR